MSSDSSKAPPAINALVKTSPITDTSAIENVATALVALQTLPLGQQGNTSNKKGTHLVLDAEAGASQVPSTRDLPPLPTVGSAYRVVSTETTLSENDSVNERSLPSSSTAFIKHPTTNEKEEDSAKPANFSRILSDPEGWLRKTENMFPKLPLIEHSPDQIEVLPNDVLCGRGGETNHHPGNVQYRSLVKAYQKLYLLAKRRDKPKIAQCIVVSIREVNGRFLKRMKDAKGDSFWVDVGNVKAREKTSQALREGAPCLRDSVNTSTTATTTIDHGMHAVPPERKETCIAPPTALGATMPTALEAMWLNANRTTSPVPPTPSPTQLSHTGLNALTAQAFTTATDILKRHPIFHQLDPAQQHHAILNELKAVALAAAKVETATISSASGKPWPHPQYQTSNHNYRRGQNTLFARSPMNHMYYAHDGNISKRKIPDVATSETAPPTTLSSFPLSLYSQQQLGFKAEAMYGGISTIADANKNGITCTPNETTNEHNRNTKKRPSTVTSMDSAASAKCTRLTSSSTIVSDTGSEESASSASFSSINSSTTQINFNNTAQNFSSLSRRGSRVKRFKSRMQDDCK